GAPEPEARSRQDPQALTLAAPAGTGLYWNGPPDDRERRTMPHANFHRRVLQVGALGLALISCAVIVGPLLLPTYPLLDSLFGFAVPLIYQRTACVVLGVIGL